MDPAGILDTHHGLCLKIIKNHRLNSAFHVSRAPDDEKYPVIIFYSSQNQKYNKYSAAANNSHYIIPYAAADSNDYCPENICGISGILNRRTESDDGKRADIPRESAMLLPITVIIRCRKNGQGDK